MYTRLTFTLSMQSAYAIGFSLLLALLCPAVSNAADVFWINPAGGNWSDTNNWSGGVVPRAADNVFITTSGTYTVILNVNASIRGLTLGGSSGLQSLTNGSSILNGAITGSIGPNGVLNLGGGTLAGTNVVTGTLNWTGGTIDDVLTVASGGVLNISGTLPKRIAGVITNAGTINWTGTNNNNDVSFYSGAIFNLVGGLFDIQNDQTLGVDASSSATGMVHNAGVLRKIAGAGTTVIAAPFNNPGTVEVQAGKILFGLGSSDMAGIFTAAAGAEINFSGGLFTLGGVTDFRGAGVVRFTGGAIRFTVPITEFKLDGGTLIGTNIVTGRLNWTGGTIDDVLTVASGGEVHISGTLPKRIAGVITNSGTINWTGTNNNNDVSFYSGAIFNLVGGLFDIQNDQTLGVDASSSATGMVHNAGVLRKTGGTGTTLIAALFNNTGTVDAQIGRIIFGGGSSNMHGAFNATVGAEIHFASGIFTLDGTPDFRGAGDIRFIGNGAARFTVPIADFELDGGTLIGTNVVTGTLNWTGGNIADVLTVANGGVLNISGTAARRIAGVITNAGTVNWMGTNDLPFYHGAIYNLAGGVFDIQNNQTLDVEFGYTGSFHNAGLLRKSGGTGTTLIAVTFGNSGTVEAHRGTITFGRGLGLDRDGILSFVLGGTRPGIDYGQVKVSGNLGFEGTLKASLTNDFMPVVRDRFDVLKYGSHTGGFRRSEGLGLTGDPFLQVLSEDQSLFFITKSLVGNPSAQATNLVDQAVAVGETAVFRIESLGQEPFSYQWRFNGSDIAGATNATLTVSNAQAANVGTYSVIVTDGLAVVRISSAVLTVLSPPNITSHPTNRVVNPGVNVVMGVTATGSGPLQYQWRLNGANIPGATNTTYTIVNAQATNGGSYSVTVANPVRAVRTAIATVVIASPSLPLADNFAARQSTNSFTGLGSGSNTNATKEGGEPDHAGKSGGTSVWYGWTAPASGIARFSTRGSSFDTLLAVYRGNTLNGLIPVASDDDQADFFASEAAFVASAGSNYVIAIDGFGGGSGNIVLSWTLDTNVTATPRILSQPVSQAALVGDNVMFSVIATSTEPLTYQWIFDQYLAIEGGTNTTLALTNVQVAAAGRYAVEVRNASGQIVRSKVVDLEIGRESKNLSQDKFRDLFRNPGAQLRLASAAASSFPVVSIGTLGIQNLNNFNATTDQGEPLHAGVIGGSSRWFILNAVEQATMVIDTQGSDFDTVLAVYTGTDLFTLQQVASDNNGAPDGVRSLVRFRTVPGTSYSVVIDGVNGAQGNIALNWKLGEMPVITSGPTNQSARVNASASFGVVASGKPAPLYQWRFKSSDIGGATNALLTLSSVGAEHIGSYHVVVSNLMGWVMSAPATLTLQEFAIKRGSAVIQGGAFRLALEGSGTQRVVIEMSDNLGDPSRWTPIWTNNSATGPNEFVDPFINQPGLRFFRAKIAD